MSWIAVGLTVASTVFASYQQNKAMDAQAEQADIDQAINANETKMAMEEENRASGLEMTQVQREALRAKSNAKANQANKGVAGVVAERQLRNVDMQEEFDMDRIRANNESKLVNISNQGQSNANQIQGVKNNANANKSSGGAVLAKSALAGLGTYATIQGTK